MKVTSIIVWSFALVIAIWVGIRVLVPRPLFMETPQGRYEVLSARYRHGTNLTFSADSAVEIALRRGLDRFGIHLKGSRGSGGFRQDIGIHAIAVRCRGRIPTDSLSQMDFECITKSGQPVRLNHWLTTKGSEDRVCFVFFYADSEIPELRRLGFANNEVTNFCPTQLHAFRKSDHHQLTILDLSH